MKTKWAILGLLGLGVVAACAYCVGSAEAQVNPGAPGQPSVMGRTRIGFVNLHEVLKNYQKYTNLRDSLKAQDEQYVTTLKVKQARLDQLANELKEKNTTPQRKEQIEQEAKQIQFDMQNIKTDAQKKLVKYHDDNVAQIYREVDQVVKEVAKANGLDIVMRYNEDWGEDYHSPAKVVGRMSLPYFPMYYDPSLEITGTVRETLNKRYAAVGAGSGVVPAGASGTPGVSAGVKK